MNKEIIIRAVEEFITNNGWKAETNEDGYQSFYKKGNMSIAIGNDEVVFITDQDDVIHFSINYETYYAVIGYMICHRMIAMDFKTI